MHITCLLNCLNFGPALFLESNFCFGFSNAVLGFFFSVKFFSEKCLLSLTTTPRADSSEEKKKVKIAAAKAKTEKRKIVMERAVIRQDVMVAPFDLIINQIFLVGKACSPPTKSILAWCESFTCTWRLFRLSRVVQF